MHGVGLPKQPLKDFEVLMTTSDAPGLEPYSDEWMDKHASEVPKQLREVVRSVCRAFWIDGADADSVGRLVAQGLKASMAERHALSNGRTAQPQQMIFNGLSWKYVGEIVSDPEQPHWVSYESVDVVNTTKF